MQPRVAPSEAWPGRFVFTHQCRNRMLRTTVLPVGPSSWTWDPETSTVTPSIRCDSCGTHGFWQRGEWRPA